MAMKNFFFSSLYQTRAAAAFLVQISLAENSELSRRPRLRGTFVRQPWFSHLLQSSVSKDVLLQIWREKYSSFESTVFQKLFEIEGTWIRFVPFRQHNKGPSIAIAAARKRTKTIFQFSFIALQKLSWICNVWYFCGDRKKAVLNLTLKNHDSVHFGWKNRGLPKN